MSKLAICSLALWWITLPTLPQISWSGSNENEHVLLVCLAQMYELYNKMYYTMLAGLRKMIPKLALECDLEVFEVHAVLK